VVVVVSVVPVVSVEDEVVLLVLVAGLVFELLDDDVDDVAVGGFPGFGGARLVVVATPGPLAGGATAVEVTGPPPVTPPETAEPPLLTTAGGLPAPAAPLGSGGTGVMLELVSVATEVVTVDWVAVIDVCVACVCSVVSERLQAANRARRKSAVYLTGCILSQDARHAFAAAADRGRAARSKRRTA
jgi:hypothetical protein